MSAILSFCDFVIGLRMPGGGRKQVPILLHESVSEFPEALLTEFLAGAYDCYSIVIATCAVGGCIVSRKRRYTICDHRRRTQVLVNPIEVYDKIANVLSNIQPSIPDVFLATPEQLADEVRSPSLAPVCTTLQLHWN
jgi:hypothetical protein